MSLLLNEKDLIRVIRGKNDIVNDAKRFIFRRI